MTINILTLFPGMFESVFSESIIKRAKEKGLVKINIYNLRDWAKDKHHITDDSPYGGGAGMVLKVDVIDRALSSIKSEIRNSKFETNPKVQNKKNSKHVSNLVLSASNFQNQPKIILLTPQGKRFCQTDAKKLSKYKKLILVCGHYEGFDERVRKLVDNKVSIGDYVLTGGEIPAMVLVDSIARLIPGVLGKKESSQEESFSMNRFIDSNALIFKNLKLKIKNSLYEYPQYTRPESYLPISKKYKRPLSVPKILLSGNHAEIKKWRIAKSLAKSRRK